jgi:hypothetical protein
MQRIDRLENPHSEAVSPAAEMSTGERMARKKDCPPDLIRALQQFGRDPIASTKRAGKRRDDFPRRSPRTFFAQPQIQM